MVPKLKEYWFFVGLGLIFLSVVIDQTGVLETIGGFFKTNHAHELLIFLIFIISGLLMEKEQIIAGVKDIGSTSLALVIIIIAAPVTSLLFYLMPLAPAVITGFFILAVMPTTLSSGVVMTGTAGGNIAHALFITILSNLIAIVSIPVILNWLVSLMDYQLELDIDQAAIMVKLILLVLLPLVVGLFAKPAVMRWLKPGKSTLQIMNQCMILMVVFIALAGAREILTSNISQLFYIIFLVAVFHIMLLFIAYAAVKLFKISKGRYEGIIFMGTQKTLPLAIVIQVSYFSEFHMAALVVIMHHIVHLMIDGYLSVKMRHRVL